MGLYHWHGGLLTALVISAGTVRAARLEHYDMRQGGARPKTWEPYIVVADVLGVLLLLQEASSSTQFCRSTP
jgi:hypothetical protein